MKKYTINEAMVLLKVLKGRLGELSSLRQTCATTTKYYGDVEKVVSPEYNVKELDKRCVEIENFLLAVETAIKQSNAITTIEIEMDAQELMRPLS